jgi:hypothetical protein
MERALSVIFPELERITGVFTKATLHPLDGVSSVPTTPSSELILTKEGKESISD